MTLGKLFIMKQSIIIYKIYKQDLVVSNRAFFSTNELPIAGETIASLLKNLWISCYTDCPFSRGRSIIPVILFQIPQRSEILHALNISKLFILYSILAYNAK